MGEVRGQLAVGGDLGEQRGGELGWVAALLAVHAPPGVDGGGGAVGVVVDRQLGPDRRGSLDEQFGAEEAGRSTLLR
jgi:hypothetical protein